MNNNNVQVVVSSYEQIKPLWDQLWHNRKSEIEPTSHMLYKQGMADREPQDPVFISLLIDGKVVGCNSIHPLPDNTVRSRGLFVVPEQRGKKLGQLLLSFSLEEAEKRYPNADFVWSFARVSSLKSYERCGFVVDSKLVPNPDVGTTNVWVIKRRS